MPRADPRCVAAPSSRANDDPRAPARATHENRPVGWFEARTRVLTVQDRELMAQHEELGILGTIGTTAEHEQLDHEMDKTVEAGHAAILAALTSRRSVERETPGQRTG